MAVSKPPLTGQKDRTMTDAPKLGFSPFARLRGFLVVFCGENLKFGTATQRALAPVGRVARRADELALQFGGRRSGGCRA